jgi:hypothetical protein
VDETAQMIKAGEAFCADVAAEMLLGADNEVQPFLVFGWCDADDPSSLRELSLMDAAIFHSDEAGLGKTLMMAFVSGALNGEAKALSMISGPDGQGRTEVPVLVFHVCEAWTVKRRLEAGASSAPMLPEGESISTQADCEEVVLIQAHRRGRTDMGEWPLMVAPSGRKEMQFKPMSFDGQFFGRLALRPATSD